MTGLTIKVATLPVLALVASAGDPVQVCFLEFFAATIRNPNTRKSYWRSATGLMAYCDQLGVGSIDQVMPLHVRYW